MNIILLFPPDFITPDRVRISGRRYKHIQEILKAQTGQSLFVGKINGLVGQGTIVSAKSDFLELDVEFQSQPPKSLPLELIMALARPPMLKRMLFSAAMLGIKKITVLNFNRVEKSLWNSSSLKEAAITEQLVLGLEQAKDTVMPAVVLKKRFKPFVEDELPALIKGKSALVAHPGSGNNVIPECFNRVLIPDTRRSSESKYNHQPIILIIGPEGGILDYEIDLLKKAGCQTIDLGPRILRTDTVLPLIVGKFFD